MKLARTLAVAAASVGGLVLLSAPPATAQETPSVNQPIHLNNDFQDVFEGLTQLDFARLTNTDWLASLF